MTFHNRILDFLNTQPENATATRAEFADAVVGPREKANNQVTWRTNRHKVYTQLGRIIRNSDFPEKGDLQRDHEKQPPTPAWTIARWKEATLESIKQKTAKT